MTCQPQVHEIRVLFHTSQKPRTRDPEVEVANHEEKLVLKGQEVENLNAKIQEQDQHISSLKRDIQSLKDMLQSNANTIREFADLRLNVIEKSPEIELLSSLQQQSKALHQELEQTRQHVQQLEKYNETLNRLYDLTTEIIKLLEQGKEALCERYNRAIQQLEKMQHDINLLCDRYSIEEHGTREPGTTNKRVAGESNQDNQEVHELLERNKALQDALEKMTKSNKELLAETQKLRRDLSRKNEELLREQEKGRNSETAFINN
ncbi:uncharacterized protein CTHT_0016980 [Thermochaetoides thermophila DSM 1495]|uniref:Uncharacterized protein n=1 Tax=Chaetomium thermophilum (strain DSM 1495 / CBS 144.50 / IMI 039719) TaxID=759272 RepID=G0S2E8_CHATD|nr:hypothetical protein CTHT_0016980 [Thermochaetoides thermophila DSM 1495]EGS22181.1 hypothetical protein CTHT_0016980 [Thermochaetoides thermophila DSM 1495]